MEFVNVKVTLVVQDVIYALKEDMDNTVKPDVLLDVRMGNAP